MRLLEPSRARQELSSDVVKTLCADRPHDKHIEKGDMSMFEYDTRRKCVKFSRDIREKYYRRAGERLSVLEERQRRYITLH
jgi:hypothetical protein